MERGLQGTLLNNLRRRSLLGKLRMQCGVPCWTYRLEQLLIGKFPRVILPSTLHRTRSILSIRCSSLDTLSPLESIRSSAFSDNFWLPTCGKCIPEEATSALAYKAVTAQSGKKRWRTPEFGVAGTLKAKIKNKKLNENAKLFATGSYNYLTKVKTVTIIIFLVVIYLFYPFECTTVLLDKWSRISV